MEYVVRGGNLFLDNFNFSRVMEEMTLSPLERAMADFAPGGHMMAASFPEEFNPMQITIRAKTDDPRIRGMCGREPGNWITAVWYENLTSFRTGANRGRVITAKGLLNIVRPDARRSVKAAMTEYVFSTLVRYEDIVDGAVVHRFDLFQGPGATVVGGQAIFQSMAANLAITGGTVL